MELIDAARLPPILAEAVEEFSLVDIGCAGGIDGAWRIFGSRLSAYGFDSNVGEIERLNAQESSPSIHYIPGLIAGEGSATRPTNNPWGRLAVLRTQQITATQREAATVEQKTAANDWQLAPRAENQISLHNYFSDNDVRSIDFLKIDIDGPDFDVLRGLREAFAKYHILGVGMEVNWFGSDDPNEHTFHNTDRFLRSCGFELYDFTKRTYAMAALPSRYALTIPAQSVSGRPLQGDAVYLRDLAAEWNAELASQYLPQKLLKLAAIFCMIGQPDSAADVLLTFRDRLAKLLDVDAALDALAATTEIGQQFRGSWKETAAAFEANDPTFYSG